MLIRVCRRCGKEETTQEPLHQNHTKPKFLGGTDIDGRILLCKKCHDTFHKQLGIICQSITELIKTHNHKEK